MSDVIKIKPSHPSQGEYVLIDAADFDESKHELLDSPVKRGRVKQIDPVATQAKEE